MFITYAEKFADMNLNQTPLAKAVQGVEQAALLHLESTDGKVGRFQVGDCTNKLFPFVDQDRNGNRAATLASQVLCDVSEECHDELTQGQRNAITGAQRSTQVWNNADIYTDQDGYGSKPFPALYKHRLEKARSYGRADTAVTQPSPEIV